MRYYDEEEAKNLNAEQWQLNLLKLNPSYCSWGCYEDYMCKKEGGWDSRVIVPDISGLFYLDELNECVNFYFEVTRSSKDCEACERSGYNPATLKLSNDWYTHSNTEGKEGWQHHLTQLEVDTLWEKGRLRGDFSTKPSPEELNRKYRKGFGHDSINQWICVETRAKQMGVYGHCEHCNGKGYIYTADKANVSLQTWILHPRKGCSRGVYVERVEQEDLPKVFAYLRGAAERNAERFSRIPA